MKMTGRVFLATGTAMLAVAAGCGDKTTKGNNQTWMALAGLREVLGFT
jgi:hypothetical protein